MLKVVDALDRVNLILLLDLSATINTVDHDILWQWLTMSFRILIQAKSLQWLDSYLTGRTQSVYLERQSTTPRNILCEVPKFSKCTQLFTLYMADIGHII